MLEEKQTRHVQFEKQHHQKDLKRRLIQKHINLWRIRHTDGEHVLMLADNMRVCKIGKKTVNSIEAKWKENGQGGDGCHIGDRIFLGFAH